VFISKKWLIFVVKFNEMTRPRLTRITIRPEVMGGKPCIRGMRVTVGMIVGLVAAGYNIEEIIKNYPYLEPEDIQEALMYAAWRADELELNWEPA
jgi:uncharacterized protein (DUF433 family)